MRNYRSVLLGPFAAACFGLFSAIAYADTTTENHPADLARFLDKATAADQRQAIFASWRDSALKGDADAQYIVGSIYRRGDDVVPQAVQRNADEARRFLSTAAAHGRELAMAKMAELELSEDHPQEAMIWAQIFGYYRGWAGKPGDDYGENSDRQPSIYFEDLLRRVSERLKQKVGDQQTALVEQQVNVFIAAHDSDIRAQLWRDGISQRWTGSQATFVNAKDFRRVGIPTGIRGMVSEWVLVFGADGSAKKVEPFDALPNFIEANSHHGLVSQYAIATAAGMPADRYALKTLELHKADGHFGPTRTR